ncbi:MAG: hypothetical protein H0X34_06805 [Chthoniobacterales bacterium]|nr:hypothetical protein [Chthoniobacterales bacterium]
MKTCKTLLVLLVCFSVWSAASAAEKIRTIADIPGLSLAVLQRTLSATIYNHVAVSPVEAWIAVRGELSGNHVFGARIIHSELNGAYDKYALELTRNWEVNGHFGLDKLNPTTPVVLNVLIFEIADGTMALSLPSFDEPRGTQFEYYGAANLAVQQSDGTWKDLELGAGPLGKRWSVRAGLANNFELQMKLNRFTH